MKMSVKLTGQEYIDFLDDTSYWEEGIWVDEVVIEVDGVEYEGTEETISPTSIVKVIGGYVVCEDGNKKYDDLTYETFIKRWLKLQTTQSLVINVPKNKLDEILAYLKLQKCKIVHK
jgi:hypothetical protein